jgi:hypothetical protein
MLLTPLRSLLALLSRSLLLLIPSAAAALAVTYLL